MDLRDWKFSSVSTAYTDWLASLPVSSDIRTVISVLGGLLILLMIWMISSLVGLFVVRCMSRRAPTNSVLEALFSYHVLNTERARLFPAIGLTIFGPPIFADTPTIRHWVEIATASLLTSVIILLLFRILDVFHSRYREYEKSGHFAIKSLVQACKVILFIFGIIAILAIIFQKSPLLVLSGFGAVTAVILLIFKDALLGLVAGIQLNINNMVRLGDWIQLPDGSANGTVVDIALTTIKVENWDKTFTCLPSYDLISNAFINWRGMSDSGGRRIMRSLNLDLQSIRFASPELLSSLGQIALLGPHLEIRQHEIDDFNHLATGAASHPANRRRLTNAGLFRAYVAAYLHSRADVQPEPFTFLVRHLQPSNEGLPIQIYVFTKTTDWAAYEGIQADIFDHLIAILPSFDLRVFQSPGGSDIASIRSRLVQPAAVSE